MYENGYTTKRITYSYYYFSDGEHIIFYCDNTYCIAAVGIVEDKDANNYELNVISEYYSDYNEFIDSFNAEKSRLYEVILEEIDSSCVLQGTGLGS